MRDYVLNDAVRAARSGEIGNQGDRAARDQGVSVEAAKVADPWVRQSLGLGCRFSVAAVLVYSLDAAPAKAPAGVVVLLRKPGAAIRAATMTARLSIVRRVEALEASASITPPDASRDDLAREIRALFDAVPHEDDRAELLRRLDDGRATDADHARLAGCSADMLRAVVGLCASV
jgi:hypothetical protein